MCFILAFVSTLTSCQVKEKKTWNKNWSNRASQFVRPVQSTVTKCKRISNTSLPLRFLFIFIKMFVVSFSNAIYSDFFYSLRLYKRSHQNKTYSNELEWELSTGSKETQNKSHRLKEGIVYVRNKKNMQKLLSANHLIQKFQNTLSKKKKKSFMNYTNKLWIVALNKMAQLSLMAQNFLRLNCVENSNLKVYTNEWTQANINLKICFHCSIKKSSDIYRVFLCFLFSGYLFCFLIIYMFTSTCYWKYNRFFFLSAD